MNDLIYLYGARYLNLYCVDVLWFSLNSCLHCCLCICFICRYCVCKWILMPTDVWNVISSTCTFNMCCNDQMYVYYLYLYVLKPISWILICTVIHSAKSSLYSYFFYVFRLLCLCILPLPYLIFTLLSKTPNKLSLNVEVPEHYYLVV